VLFHLGWQFYRGEFHLGSEIKQQLPRLKTRRGLFVLALLLAGLFFAGTRYGGNLIHYQTPVPACQQVISLDRCKAFDPIGRDEGFKDRKLNQFIDSPWDHVDYVKRWYTQMVWEMYFSVAPLEQHFAVRRPLQPTYTIAWIIAGVTTLVVLVRARWLWRQGTAAQLFLLGALVYCVVLFGKNYSQYLETGVGVAVHGRYIFPILPLLGFLVYLALRRYVAKVPANIRYPAFALMLLLLFWGGGIVPFVIGSNDGWLMPYMVESNQVLRAVLWPFVIK